jgi:DNA invertase Pin-like site-specific DNA recombinase
LERQREGITRGKYKGRKPTARLRQKAENAVRLYRGGKRVAHIVNELDIGRAAYSALEAAGLSIPQ